MIKFKELTKEQLQKLVDSTEVGPTHYVDFKLIKNIIKEEYNIDISLKFAHKIWIRYFNQNNSLHKLNNKMYNELCKTFEEYIEIEYHWLSDSEIQEIFNKYG